jgi:DNA-binding GntR family transcriptional regulator
MEFQKINTKTLREHVYTLLREAIINGKVLPGQSISLRSLSEQFGVSMQPIREALWQLESEEILLMESNRRFHVNSLTAMQMREVLRLKDMLEADAASRACQRRTPDAIAQLERLLKELRSSLKEHERYMEVNHRFHFHIYACAESPLLLGFLNKIWARIAPYNVIYSPGSQDLPYRFEYHKRMFSAFDRGRERELIRALHDDAVHASLNVFPNLKD